MYNEILDELGDLATVVSRNYVYGKIKDRTGCGMLFSFNILINQIY